MKNKIIVLGILLFLFTPNIKAIGWNDVNKDNLPGRTNYYAVAEGNIYGIGNGLYLMYFNIDRGFISYTDEIGPTVQSQVCSQYGICFTYLRGNTNNATSWEYQRFNSTYYSLDNGNTWTLQYQNYYIGSGISNANLLYTSVDLYSDIARYNNQKIVNANFKYLSYQFPTFTNTIYVEEEKIKIGFEFTSWPDTRITSIRTGPLLQKEYTYQDYLESNTFSINYRFPNQNVSMPIEYYDNDTLVKTGHINITAILESMPQDIQNEVIAQEQYQENIYQWESGDYSSTIKNTLNDSSLTIGWVREMLEYIFGKFPIEVRYALISLFIVILIVCIIRMIWR